MRLYPRAYINAPGSGLYEGMRRIGPPALDRRLVSGKLSAWLIDQSSNAGDYGVANEHPPSNERRVVLSFRTVYRLSIDIRGNTDNVLLKIWIQKDVRKDEFFYQYRIFFAIFSQ